ncbi:hypothetical protein QJS10_CPA10g00599 [Acorus calamus]|uniref:Uncharacterized protein n=1 Tax=Acorus calamus TaxID=4465 RepID=A0AAV9DXL5_ACOCL|nr:hypothetical protein QJS10_CPA10g00599 [Acorus calamus]
MMGKSFLLLSMLMFFSLLITPTTASRAIPTSGEPVEKESQVAEAAGQISHDALARDKPIFSYPALPKRGCSPYYYRCSPPNP